MSKMQAVVLGVLIGLLAACSGEDRSVTGPEAVGRVADPQSNSTLLSHGGGGQKWHYPTPTPPPATCLNTRASSSAYQPFTLPNSSVATESKWVNDNVRVGPFVMNFRDDGGFTGPCTASNGAARVVLVKAGRDYGYFLNTVDQQDICSLNGQNISHVSYFGCALTPTP